jgi:hypothetical protein
MMVACQGITQAEIFTMMVTDSDPLGLRAIAPAATGMDLGLEGAVKGAFSYGIGVTSEYNSNFFQTDGNEESELAGFINPWLAYTTDPEGGAIFTITANYTPSFRFYSNNSDLDGIDQTGDLNFSFRGSRTKIDIFGRYAQSSGTDLLTGDFIEGTVATGGIQVTRQIASRTSLDASYTYATSDYGGSGTNEGASVQTASLSGYWQATERLSYGPTLRYTHSDSGTIGGRDAWALMLSARYKAGERTFLSASLGPEYSTTTGVSGGDDSSFGVTGNLTASYMIDERWTWNASLNSAAVPSPNQSNFVINNVTVSTGLSRKLLRGSISGGIDYVLSNYDEVDTVAATRGAENNFALFINYGRGLFSERVGLNTGVRYSFNEGETDWSQFLVSVGLNMAF